MCDIDMDTVNKSNHADNDYQMIKDMTVPADVVNEITYPLEHAIMPYSVSIINANKFDISEMHEERTWAMMHIANSHESIFEMRRGIPFSRRRHMAMMVGLIAADYDGCGDMKTKTGNPIALRSLATELAEMCLDIYIGMPGMHFVASNKNGNVSFMPYMELDGENESYQATPANIGIDKIKHQKAKHLINSIFADDNDGNKNKTNSDMIRAAMHTANQLGLAYENAIRYDFIENGLYRAADRRLKPSPENHAIMSSAKDAIIIYTQFAPHIGSMTDRDACLLIDDIVEIMSRGIQKADSIVDMGNVR